MTQVLVKRVQKLGNSYMVRFSNKEAAELGLMLGSYVNLSPSFPTAKEVLDAEDKKPEECLVICPEDGSVSRVDPVNDSTGA